VILNASGTELHRVEENLEDGNSINKGNETERNVQAEIRDCLNAKEGMEIEAAVGKDSDHGAATLQIGVQVTVLGARGPRCGLTQSR
jgi:hypothetical protein